VQTDQSDRLPRIARAQSVGYAVRKINEKKSHGKSALIVAFWSHGCSWTLNFWKLSLGALILKPCGVGGWP